MSSIYSMPGHLVRRLQQISASVFAEQMRAANLDLTSPQFAALAILYENPGIDQATLAGLIALDRPTIGGVVDRLSAKGLVERQTSNRDRRSKALNLTQQGKILFDQLQPIVERCQDAMLPGLTQSEKAEFIRLASKVAEAGNHLSRAPLVTTEPNVKGGSGQN